MTTNNGKEEEFMIP
jgi:hypothetical protein